MARSHLDEYFGEFFGEKIGDLLTFLLTHEETGYAVLALGIFWVGYLLNQAHERWEDARFLRDEPFTPIDQVTRPGFYKINGRLESEFPLSEEFLPGEPLVYYELTREKEVEGREDPETHAREKYWQTIESFVREVPFSLADRSGRIPIKHKGALMDQEVLVSQTASGDAVAGLLPRDLVGLITRTELQGLGRADLLNRIEITGLRAGKEYTILGFAQRKSDTDPLFLGLDPEENFPFLITNKPLRELYREKISLAAMKVFLASCVLALTLSLFFLALPGLRATWGE